mgnify:FL=1|jgi:hypothetical protein
MYLTILNYTPKNEVLTYELPHFATKFRSEEMEEFMDYTLGIDINSCDWMTHEDLPKIATIIDTNV